MSLQTFTQVQLVYFVRDDLFLQKLKFNKIIVIMRNPSIFGKFWWPYPNYTLYSELEIVIIRDMRYLYGIAGYS